MSKIDWNKQLKNSGIKDVSLLKILNALIGELPEWEKRKKGRIMTGFILTLADIYPGETKGIAKLLTPAKITPTKPKQRMVVGNTGKDKTGAVDDGCKDCGGAKNKTITSSGGSVRLSDLKTPEQVIAYFDDTAAMRKFCEVNKIEVNSKWQKIRIGKAIIESIHGES